MEGMNGVEIESRYDRERELKAFDERKVGVKGLVDAGATKLPQIFIHDLSKLGIKASSSVQPSVPIIELGGIDEDASRHSETVEKLRNACETWGFFQVINHGIPASVLYEVIDGVRSFHEQDTEVKKQFYSRDETKNVIYNTNFDFYRSSEANWRDSLYCVMAPKLPNLEEFPVICRDVLIDYSRKVLRLGSTLFELMSEALGLNPNHLKDIGCAEGPYLIGHYYPACPEPESTLGLGKHTDSAFLTMLLQDEIGGLQVLHEEQWIDVRPIPGALIVNCGDMLQLITNDRFKSVHHRVLAKDIGPRISVACFFRTHLREDTAPRMYGSIKELLSEDCPAIYKETTVKDYISHVYSNRLGGAHKLDYLKL